MQLEERDTTQMAPTQAAPGQIAPSQIAPRPATLTAREEQIASGIAAGRTNRDIASRLGITEQTVKNHLTSIFEKVGVDNRLQLGLALVKRS